MASQATAQLLRGTRAGHRARATSRLGADNKPLAGGTVFGGSVICFM